MEKGPMGMKGSVNRPQKRPGFRDGPPKKDRSAPEAVIGYCFCSEGKNRKFPVSAVGGGTQSPTQMILVAEPVTEGSSALAAVIVTL